MRRTYLIQRLCPPRERLANPFTFGGGLQDGGLTEDAVHLLSPIFSCDYMGAAEFEFGALPRALSHLANKFASGNGAAWSCKVKGREVFILSENGLAGAQIVPILNNLAEGKLRLKEPSKFDEVLSGKSDRYIGWIELDNSFVFFVDAGAFEKMKTLFESFTGQCGGA